jgi:hypothetical protein
MFIVFKGIFDIVCYVKNYFNVWFSLPPQSATVQKFEFQLDCDCVLLIVIQWYVEVAKDKCRIITNIPVSS